MKSIGAEVLRPDALPGVSHMRGMQYIINSPLVASHDIHG